jgi:hypothetical protein
MPGNFNHGDMVRRNPDFFSQLSLCETAFFAFCLQVISKNFPKIGHLITL